MLEIKSMIKNFKLKELFWITPIILSVIGASLSLSNNIYKYINFINNDYNFPLLFEVLIDLYEKKFIHFSNDWCSNIFYSRFAFKSAIDTYYGHTNYLYKQTYSLGIKII